jgi:hypothetical protein
MSLDLTTRELAHRATLLSERIFAPGVHNSRVVVAALSANGRWGYEKEGRRWVIIDKTGRESLNFETSLTAARRLTFEIDHPIHTVARQPRPATYTVV